MASVVVAHNGLFVNVVVVVVVRCSEFVSYFDIVGNFGVISGKSGSGVAAATTSATLSGITRPFNLLMLFRR